MVATERSEPQAVIGSSLHKIRVDDEPVARRSGVERAIRQELPQLGDIDLQRVARRVGRRLAPNGIDEAVT